MELKTLVVILALSFCGAVHYPYPEGEIVLVDNKHPGSGEFIEYGYLNPMEYYVNLELIDANVVGGYIELVIKCVKSTDAIHLHAENMNITSIKLTKEANPPEDHTWQLGVPENHFLRIKLKNKMTEGKRYFVYIHFNYLYSETSRGLRKSPLRPLYANESGFLTTHFKHIYARRAFPCFDMPWYSHKIRFTLTTNSNYKCLTTVPISHRTAHKNSTMYKVCEFTFKKAPTNEVGFTVYDPDKGMDEFSLTDRNEKESTNQTSQGWRMIVKDMDVYWTAKLSPYMASPNILTLYGPKQSSDEPIVIGQEYYDPSQYFTWDLETVKNSGFKEFPHASDLLEIESKSWRNLWLKDGLTTFYRFLYTASMYPTEKEKLMEMFTVSYLMKAMAMDFPPSAKDIGNYAVHTPAILGKIDDVTSYKAATFLRTLCIMVGEGNFISITNNFIERSKGKVLDPIDYYKSFDKFSVLLKLKEDGKTLRDVFSSWVDQPGYQIVFMDRRYNGKEYFISFTNSIRKPTMSWVPLNYRIVFRHTSKDDLYNNNSEFWWWKPKDGKFDDRKISFDSSAECFIFNQNFYGYIRIIYDASSWRRIIICLNNMVYRNFFPPLNRAQLIHDAFFFLMHDHLDAEKGFNLVQAFTNEIEIVPWIALYENLKHFESLLRNRPNFASSPFKDFKRKVSKKFLDHVITNHGIDVKEDDGQVIRSTRMLALRIASEYDVKSITKEIELKFEGVLKNPVSFLHRDLHFIVLCHGIKNSNDSVYDTIMTRYENSSSLATKQLIAESLGCSNNTKLTDKVLVLIRDENSRLRVSEKIKIFQRLAQGEDTTLGKVLNFLEENKHNIRAMIGDDGLREVIGKMVYQMVSSRKIKRFNNLLDYWKSNNVLSKTLDEAILRRVEYIIEMNLKWMLNSGFVMDWLEENKKSF